MKVVSCRAYAKINLTLDVGARRADGYHDIRSVMQTVALHDTLTVTRAPASGMTLEVTGEEAGGVPANETNLVHRAATLLAGPQAGLHIRLHKRIPSQAGLGGGSSDAAAAMRAVNELLGLDVALKELAAMGASLGADVPFFFTGGTALAEGRGENVTSLPPLTPPWPLVLVKPPVGVPTAAAYAALDALPGRVSAAATDAWLRGKSQFSNDFEPLVLRGYPAVARAYEALCWTDESGECFTPLLCGSGAALWSRVPTPDAARALAKKARAAKVGTVWVTRTQGADE